LRARRYLETAWSAGERDADVAAALGFTLSALYDEESRRARLLSDEKRLARQHELERTLRDPALQFLRGAEGAVDTSPEYVAASIDLLEGRDQAAATRAEAAFAHSRSLYESGLVEVKALHAMARKQWMSEGGHPQARASWEKMRRVEDQLLDVARS